MQRLKFICLMLGVLIALSGLSHAQEAKRDQVAAANGRALEGLRTQVAAEPVGNGLTVGDLLNKTRSTKTLMQTLARAQQIGGPRWLDADTCQVRLEIGGPIVAKALVAIAKLDNRTPIAPEVLQGRLKDWDNRTFSATGTSTCATAAETMMSDKARRQAVCDARRDAVAQVFQSIRSVSLGDGRTVADALTEPAIKDPVEKWINQRPVTQVEFRDEQQARVTLAISGNELFDAFYAAAEKHPKATGPMDEAAWNHVRDEFSVRVGPAAGRAMASNVLAAPAPSPVALPRTPPDWVERQFDAEGVSAGKSSPLKAARAAEADAIEKLRAKLEPLVLSPGLTLGEAARRDKQINLAIDRALGRAETRKVDYRADAGARATVTLDLHDLWQEIQSP